MICLFLYTYIYINGGSHGKDCCRKRIRGARGGQGATVTTIPNSNHNWSSGIGSDVVLTPGNFRAYPDLKFS